MTPPLPARTASDDVPPPPHTAAAGWVPEEEAAAAADEGEEEQVLPLTDALDAICQLLWSACESGEGMVRGRCCWFWC